MLCLWEKKKRYSQYKSWKYKIALEGGYEKFSRGYENFGFQITKTGITYREWAPNAIGAYLFGDFSKHYPMIVAICQDGIGETDIRCKPHTFQIDNWNPSSHPMKRDQYGVYEIELPNNADGTPAIQHNSKVKVLDAILQID